MKRKYKIIIALAILVILVFCFALTYSLFHSNSTLNSNDQNIAKFIFNAEKTDQIELPLIDLKPGDVKEYLFAVSNNSSQTISDVSLEYQLIIETYHLMPLDIELYKINGEEEVLILTCDETYTRNAQNKLICNAPIQELAYDFLKQDDYKLKVSFQSEYNSESYANLIDYINVEIKSWQKTDD